MATESIKSLALEHITRDPQLQMRVTINVDHVEELRSVLETDGELPTNCLPVVFSSDGRNWLADGNHTFEAHKAAGLKKMKCLVKPGGFREAWVYSLSANGSHGLKRTQADKRKAVTAALKDPEMSKRSDSEIARLCGLRWHNLPSDIRKELAAGIDKSTQRFDGHTWRDEKTNEPVKQPEPEPIDDWDAPVPTVAKPVADYPAELDEGPVVDAEIDQALAEADQGTTGVYDAKGRPVGEDLLPIFAERKRIVGIRSELGRLATEIKHLKHGDGASLMPTGASYWIDAKHVGLLIDDIQRNLRFGSPFVICPQCGGKGKRAGEACGVCKGHRFIPESAYSRLDTDLKGLAEQWTPKGEAWEGEDQPKKLTAENGGV